MLLLSVTVCTGYFSHFALPRRPTPYLPTSASFRLNWRLTVITPLHLLGLFHSIGVLFNDDLVSRKPIEQRVSRRHTLGWWFMQSVSNSVVFYVN